MYTYFSVDSTIEETRKNFRDLCLKLHPDKGGNHDLFIAMKAEYEKVIGILSAFEAGKANRENRKTNFSSESERALSEKIESLLNIPEIIVEICGSWLWISGKSFEKRELLKAEGCKFAPSKKLWFWAFDSGNYKRGRYSMDKIRSKFGSERIESQAKERTQIA